MMPPALNKIDLLADKLDLLVGSDDTFLLNDKSLKLGSWKVKDENIELNVRDKNDALSKIVIKIEKLADILVPTDESTYTINYLRKKLIDNIVKIESGDLETGKAKEITNHVQTIINITKLELEYRKHFVPAGEGKPVQFLE